MHLQYQSKLFKKLCLPFVLQALETCYKMKQFVTAQKGNPPFFQLSCFCLINK